MVWTVWVPAPGIHVMKNHRKLLAWFLQLLTVLLFLKPTSSGQCSHSSLAQRKERHEANQHPKKPACCSCVTSAVTGQPQNWSSGLSVVYCSSAHSQTSTPSFAPLNCLHHLHWEFAARGIGLVTWQQTNSRTVKAGLCKQVRLLKHHTGKSILLEKYFIHHNANASDGIIIPVWSRQPQHPTNSLLWKHIKQVTRAAELAINGGCVAPLECARGAINEESENTIKPARSSQIAETIMPGFSITTQPKANAFGLQQSSAAINLPPVYSARGSQV